MDGSSSEPQGEVPRPRRSAFLRALHNARCPLVAQVGARRSARNAVVSSPPNHESASYRELAAELRSAAGTHGNADSTCKVHRLLEAVRRGAPTPYAAVASRYVPTERVRVVDAYKNRVYGGRFMRNGDLFVTSCMDRLIRVYTTAGEWRIAHRVPCEDVRWTITDYDLSPDGRWLLYATINQYVHLVDLHHPSAPQRTLCAVNAARDEADHFGVMSCCFSSDGLNVLLGCTGTYNEPAGTLRILDLERGGLYASVEAHDEDVNCIRQLRTNDPNLLLTAGDDAFAKMWDRRQIGRAKSEPAAAFAGHVEGLTHLDSRNDSRYFITQGKDQCIKLWDVRHPTTGELPTPPKDRTWDYRFESYPGRRYMAADYVDDAIMTYAGAHQTLQTLIRCYFSPTHSTAQRYIYTGSGSCHGSFAVYDVLSGQPVAKMKAHRAPLRDLSWHPTLPLLATVGWDHNVVLWRAGCEQ